MIFNVQNRTVGAWQFTTDNGGNWNPIPTAAQGATSGSYMVLRDDAMHQIRYVPNPNAFTTGTDLPSLSVRAWDDTEQTGTITGGTIVLGALTGDLSSETEGSVSENSGTLRLTINLHKRQQSLSFSYEFHYYPCCG